MNWRSLMKRDSVRLAGIFLLTGLFFGNIFSNEFVLEDFDYIVNRPLIHSLVNLPRFFAGYIPPDGQPGIYAPLKTLFCCLNYLRWELNPVGYHLVALTVHLWGVLMAWAIARRFLQHRQLALLSAVLFAVHPVHVESVTAMAASMDTLGAVFLLTAFYFYIRAVGHPSLLPGWGYAPGPDALSYPSSGQEGGRGYYFLALAFSCLSIFTYEFCLTLPLLFCFYDVFFAPTGKWRNKLARLVPFFLLAAFYLAAKISVLGGLAHGGYLLGNFGLTMLVVVKAVFKAVCLMFFPVFLSYNHVLAPGISSFGMSEFDRQSVLSQSLLDSYTGPAFLFLLLILSATFRFRRRPLVIFAVGWFFLSLLPSFNIIPNGIYLQERSLYHGSVAWCMLMAVMLYRLPGLMKTEFSRRVMKIGLVGMVLFFGGRVWWRNAQYRDVVTAMEAAVWGNPQSAALRLSLSQAYLQTGDLPRAQDSLQKAIALNPYNTQAYFWGAILYQVTGDTVDAMQSLLQAVAINPDFAEAYYNLAGIYYMMGQDEEGAVNFNKAINLLRQQGRVLEAGEYALRMDEALRSYRQQEQANPQ